MRNKNHYTKWYVIPADAEREEEGYLLGKEPEWAGYPVDTIAANGDRYFPVVSTQAGWRANREGLRRYAQGTGALWSFLQYKGHWALLQKCFGRHFKQVMKELLTEFNVQNSDAKSIANWDITRFPNPITMDM